MTAIIPVALLVGIHDSEETLIDLFVNESKYLSESRKVRNNQEAIEFLTGNECKIIIIHSILEDADCRDLINNIRKTLKLDTPILVVSNIPGDKYFIDCISLDAQGFMSLPLDFDSLKNEIDRILFLKANQEAIQKGEKLYQDSEDGVSDEILKDKNLLVVDDDYFMQEIVKDILISKGAKVDTASNGEEALHAIKPNYYSCVILDIQMPNLDGFQVLKTIRGNPQFWNLPVIILSSLGKEDDILKGYKLGANEYLLKPVNADALTARIKSLLL